MAGRRHVFAAAAASVGVALFLGACAQKAPVISDSTVRLAALKTDWWQFYLRENPEAATALGEYRFNDKLSDDSLEHVPQVRREAAAMLDRLKAIDTKTLSEPDQLDHTLLVHQLEDQIAGIDLKTYLMPVDQFNGIQLALPQIATYAPFDSVKHYEDYVSRLRQMPEVLEHATAAMRQGMQEGLMQPRFILEETVGQCEKIATPAGEASAFATPVKKFPDSISEADRTRLRAEVVKVIDEDVRPAYKRFQEFIAKDYAPKGRKDPGIWALPDGEKRYLFDVHMQTTSPKTPDQIHELGLAQVAGIEKQLDELGKKAGYPDGKSYRKAALTDAKFKAKSRQEILDAYTRYIAAMEPKLPQLFGRLPKAKVVVTSVPEYMEKESSTQYINGTPDGSRAGQVWVVTYDPTHHNIIEDEATAYHEGIPGHHMQISIAQELPLHPFHHALGYNAYVEGWALYAERLGKEVGFYQDPASELGRLQSEMFRAVRLVVDTGVHWKHWSREQMVAFFNEHYGDTPQSEVDRYIAWPAQALGYKLGQLQILELRELAQKELGPKYDIRAFNDEILNAGPLPLDVLDARVRRWIETAKAGAAR